MNFIFLPSSTLWFGCCVIIQTSSGSDLKMRLLVHNEPFWSYGADASGLLPLALLVESSFSPVHRKGDHLICRQGLLGADGSIPHPTTPGSQLASPRCMCALCLSHHRWPVSWSSLRVTWNVQRSGRSSQKGKRARRQDAVCGVLLSSD